MFYSTIPRRATIGVSVLFAVALPTACGSSTELTTPTKPDITAASTSANVASTTASAPPTSATSATSAAVAAATTAPNPAPTTAATDATSAPNPDQRAELSYDHPDLGPVTISISYPQPTDATLIAPTVRATANATGQTVFEWTGPADYRSFNFAGADFNPGINDPVDGRGHVFFEWDPGRYPGVSYLVATPTGFDSNGTLGDSYNDGHYEALLVDTDGDGNYEVKQGFDNCDPSCAEGYVYSHIWSWDGGAYTGSDVDPGREAAEPLGDVSQFEPAKAAFTEYLLAVGAREYERAWDMLEPEYQNEYGGYDRFTAFWDTIDSVGVESLEPYWGYGVTILEGSVWFQLRDGTRQTEDVSVTMSYGDPPKIAGYTSYGAAE